MVRGQMGEDRWEMEKHENRKREEKDERSEIDEFAEKLNSLDLSRANEYLELSW